MSASSPTTRIVPSATAVVNGDRSGAKERRYGSSDVSENAEGQLRVHLRRQRQAARARDRQARATARRISIVSMSPRSDSAPVTCADAFVAGEEVGDAEPDVVARGLERAGAGAR